MSGVVDPTADPAADWVRIGVIGRPHGVRGLLKLHLDNRDSKTLRKGLGLRLTRKSPSPGGASPGGASPGGASPGRPSPGGGDVVSGDVVVSVGAGIVGLEKVPDRNAAEALVGAEVFVKRSDFVEDEDEVFLIDAIGKDVVDGAGVLLGRITGFDSNGAQPLAEIKTPAGKIVLVPFVPPIVQRVADVVELAPPVGLFNLDEE